MRIYNVNIKFIIFIILLVIILITLFVSAIYLINVSTMIMTEDNYTSILKSCHDEPYKYLGKRIISSGYIFRNENFSDTQFVVARDMLVSEDESRIVGFLCEYKDAKEFESNAWVKISGTITVGDYYGAMPIININSIHKITTPENIFVFPPCKE